MPGGSWLALVRAGSPYLALSDARWRARAHQPARGLRARQPENGGVETLTVMPDGRVIAIGEEYSLTPGLLVGWIGQPGAEGRYSWQSFQYAKTPDFNPTAAALLPDGGFVMLERAFDVARGVRVRVMGFETAELQPGGTIRARELARLASPVAVDNLEGIAAAKGPRGETLLWLISDDNFNPLQRSLLLLFEPREVGGGRDACVTRDQLALSRRTVRRA